MVFPLNPSEAARISSDLLEKEKFQFRVFAVQGMILGVVWVEGQ